MKDLNLFIKQCYHIIVWSVEKKKEIKNPKFARTKNGRKMLLWNCVVCDSKKSKFRKQQEASWFIK